MRNSRIHINLFMRITVHASFSVSNLTILEICDLIIIVVNIGQRDSTNCLLVFAWLEQKKAFMPLVAFDLLVWLCQYIWKH